MIDTRKTLNGQGSISLWHGTAMKAMLRDRLPTVAETLGW